MWYVTLIRLIFVVARDNSHASGIVAPMFGFVSILNITVVKQYALLTEQ